MIFFFCVLLVGFQPRSERRWIFFLSAFFFWWSLDEGEREREREKNGWVASEPDDGRQANRSFPLLVGFLFSVLSFDQNLVSG